MTPHLATLSLSIVLIAMSAWGYLGSDTPSFTALIPAGFGVALLGCYPGVRKENKVVAHIAVGLVALLTLALFMPLRGAISRGDTTAIVRVCVMLVASIGTIFTYVGAFRAARRAREAEAEE